MVTYARYSGASTVTLTNSTLSRNTAGAVGGGVYNGENSYGTSVVTLARSLVAGNTAPAGAEIHNL